MQSPLPLQFLVGLTRVIAIFFGLQGADSWVEAFVYWNLQRSQLPKLPSQLPNLWSLFIPIFLFYLILTVAVWFAAPLLCRMAFSNKKNPDSSTEPTSSGVSWNESMIFLTGTCFVAWGIIRLANPLQVLSVGYLQHSQVGLNLEQMIELYATICLIGLGAILMGRFASIHRWMQRKRATEQQPV